MIKKNYQIRLLSVTSNVLIGIYILFTFRATVLYYTDQFMLTRCIEKLEEKE